MNRMDIGYWADSQLPVPHVFMRDTGRKDIFVLSLHRNICIPSQKIASMETESSEVKMHR